jgi:hypothetical protein
VSPGRTAFAGTPSLLVTLVAGDSVTFTVLPEASVTYRVLPLIELTVPNVPLPPLLGKRENAPEAPAGKVRLEVDGTWSFSTRTPA